MTLFEEIVDWFTPKYKYVVFYNIFDSQSVFVAEGYEIVVSKERMNSYENIKLVRETILSKLKLENERYCQVSIRNFILL